MSGNNAVAAVTGFFTEVWQNKNPQMADKFVTESFAVTSGGKVIGPRPVFKQWVSGFLASINDFSFEIIEIFQNQTGDRVTARWRVTGKNNGFMGTEACQSPIDMTGTAVFHVLENGLLQHNWVERNAHEVFQSFKK